MNDDVIPISVNLAALTIEDMRAISRLGAPMSNDEATDMIRQVFDALHRAGLGSLPLSELPTAIRLIWDALGKLGQASTTES